MACCASLVPNVLHMICTQLHSGHLNISGGDSSQCSEEIVKNLELHLLLRSLLSLLALCCIAWLPALLMLLVSTSSTLKYHLQDSRDNEY